MVKRFECMWAFYAISNREKHLAWLVFSNAACKVSVNNAVLGRHRCSGGGRMDQQQALDGLKASTKAGWGIDILSNMSHLLCGGLRAADHLQPLLQDHRLDLRLHNSQLTHSCSLYYQISVVLSHPLFDFLNKPNPVFHKRGERSHVHDHDNIVLTQMTFQHAWPPGESIQTKNRKDLEGIWVTDTKLRYGCVNPSGCTSPHTHCQDIGANPPATLKEQFNLCTCCI